MKKLPHGTAKGTGQECDWLAAAQRKGQFERSMKTSQNQVWVWKTREQGLHWALAVINLAEGRD